MEDFKKIEEELIEKAQKVEEVNLLFVDLSSTCTGFTKARVNFRTHTAWFEETGSVWIPKLSQEDKCAYIYNAFVNYFNIVIKTDYVIMEKYSINPKKMMGVLVSPELHGAVKAALSECGIKMSYVYPQSWHAGLGLKKDSKGYKGPTKQKILTMADIPDKIENNLTHKTRNTSSDLYDALGIGVYFLQKVGIKTLNFDTLKLQPHVGLIDET